MGRPMNRLTHALLARALVLSAALAAAGCSAEMSRSPPGPPIPVRCQEITPAAFQVDTRSVSSFTPFAQQHFRERLEEFSAAPLNCREIVMLGDSLTELNDWNQSVRQPLPLRNRGISGDTSDGVLLRLDEIIAVRPRAVFLMIGTNDLWSGNSPEMTAANIVKITDLIRAQSPSTLIFVQTIPPVRGDPSHWGGTPNKKARVINARLKADSAKAGFILLDTYALMADDTGAMNAAYTTDGVHLNAKGYKVWSALVSDALRSHGLPGNAP